MVPEMPSEAAAGGRSVGVLPTQASIIQCFYEENFRRCGEKVTPKWSLARRTVATLSTRTGGKGTRPPRRPKTEAIERRRPCAGAQRPNPSRNRGLPVFGDWNTVRGLPWHNRLELFGLGSVVLQGSQGSADQFARGYVVHRVSVEVETEAAAKSGLSRGPGKGDTYQTRIGCGLP
jgi:hypothetical protein